MVSLLIKIIRHQLAERAEIDRWVISKLHSLIKEVTAAYDDYEPTKAARAMEEFVI
jgi:isoleucyl-tRNA synthetase